MNRHQRRAAKRGVFEAQVKKRNAYGYDESHYLVERKITPDVFDQLRAELLQPEHYDIFKEAASAGTFEEAIGIIAAKLDIALDGEYEPVDLFHLLFNALRRRASFGNDPSGMHPNLVAAEIVERDNDVSLQFAGARVDTVGVEALPTFDGFSRFMREHGCTICESREACRQAEKCLGDDAFTVAQQKQLGSFEGS